MRKAQVLTIVAGGESQTFVNVWFEVVAGGMLYVFHQAEEPDEDIDQPDFIYAGSWRLHFRR